MIGRTLARTYQVDRLLGGGGMGAVYAARHVRTGGMFAVKVLHRETAADADIYKRFQDEARTVSALRHPNIVQVTDFDAGDDGTPFIVMELLEGEDLYQRLCRVTRLPVEQVVDIGRQVGSALHAAHDRGVIHRDIKPQNIFLERHEMADMVTETAKVVDFGISKIRRVGGQMTRDMTILGTPQFMSPEAALGQNSQLDGRADQWSLGVIMYLCLSGKLPFDGENLVGVLYMVVHEQPTPLKQLCPDVPDHVAATIERAMSKRKDDRFPRMADFVRALSALPAVGQRSGSAAVPASFAQRVPAGLLPSDALATGPDSPAKRSAPVPLVSSPTPHLSRTPQRAADARFSQPVPPQTEVLPSSERATQVALGHEGFPITAPLVPNALELTQQATDGNGLAPRTDARTQVTPVIPAGEARRSPSGETPTSITMNSSAFDALMQDSEKTPVTGLPKVSGSERQTQLVPADAGLVGAPTRVGVMPPGPSGDPHLTLPNIGGGPVAPGQSGLHPVTGPNSATLPLIGPFVPERPGLPPPMHTASLPFAVGGSKRGSSMNPTELGSFEPPTAGSKLVPSNAALRFAMLRERLFLLAGLHPRDPQRMAITGAVAGVLFILLILLCVL